MDRVAAFSRKCHILNQNGQLSDLLITFYIPEISREYGGYIAYVDLNCDFFSRTLRGGGLDEAQAFFCLPLAATAYLKGQRRFGYEAYWLEPGDFDCADFWTYKQ